MKAGSMRFLGCSDRDDETHRILKMPHKIALFVFVFLVSISWSGRNLECDDQRYLEIKKMESDSLSRIDSGFVAFYGVHCLESQSDKKEVGAPYKSDRGFDAFVLLVYLAAVVLYTVANGFHF
jgi:hypothetical protein